MPIETSVYDDNILLVKLIGNVEGASIDAFIANEGYAFVSNIHPKIGHLIFDVREFGMDFNEFIKFLSLAGARRKAGTVPPNNMAHFIGKNAFIDSIRTWLQKNYSAETSAFLNLDDALSYIRSSSEPNLKEA